MSRGLELACWAVVVRDGEAKASKAGNSYAVVNVAVNDGSTDQDGKQTANYLRVFAFGQLASAAANLRKGDRCYIEGQLAVDVWQPENGPPRPNLTLKAFTLTKTGIGKSRARGSGEASGQALEAHKQPAEPAFSDAIPF